MGRTGKELQEEQQQLYWQACELVEGLVGGGGAEEDDKEELEKNGEG